MQRIVYLKAKNYWYEKEKEESQNNPTGYGAGKRTAETARWSRDN